MKYEITRRGVEGCKIGDIVEVEGDETPAWLVNKAVPLGADKPNKNVTASEPPADFVPPVGPFTAKESSPGWWAIFDGKDQAVGKKARKAELDGFDTLSDDDKLEFATQHAKAAFDADQKKA